MRAIVPMVFWAAATSSLQSGVPPVSFHAPPLVQADNYVTSVAFGDFNGDGIVDVAAVPFAGGSVAIYLGLGNGYFSIPTYAPIAAGSATIVQAADFNRDGKVDLAVAASEGSLSPGSVSILLGIGDGTFQPAVAYSFPGTYGDGNSAMIVTDLNSDGVPDIAVTSNLVDAVSVLIGNGDGTFQPQTPYLMVPSSASPGSMTSGDFNNDGNVDLAIFIFAVGTYSDSPIGVLIYPGNGNGTLGNPTLVATDQFVTALTAGVLKPGGNVDLAAGFSGGALIFPGNGNGTFQNPFQLGTVGVDSLILKDLLGSGNLDLAAVCKCGTTQVFPGTGQGTFGSPALYAPGGSVIAAQDVNNDGRPDLLVSGNPDFALLLNNAGGRLERSPKLCGGRWSKLNSCQQSSWVR